MPQQQIIWTAIPNGMAGDASGAPLRLSVYVSPRLRFDGAQETGTLDSFPHFVDWPARLREGRIELEVVVDESQPGTERPPVRAAIVTRDPPESEVWRALFGGNTLVRSHLVQRVDEPLLRNPTAELAASVRTAYAGIGRDSPFQAPGGRALREAFPNVVRAIAAPPAQSTMLDRLREAATIAETELGTAHRDLGEQLLRRDPSASFEEKLAAATTIAGRLARSGAASRGVPVVPRTGSGESAVVQFAAFHSRVPAAARVAPRSGTATRIADAGRMDFHRMLSALAEYPALLRKLGLVIDLEVPAAAVPESVFGALKRLRVVPVFTPAVPSRETYSPATKYIHDVRTGVRTFPFPIFAAAPRRAAAPPGPDPLPELEVVAGLLNLGLVVDRVNPFRMVQFDVDGAMKKVVNAIQSDTRDDELGHRPVDATGGGAAPALRTSGLSLVREGHAEQVLAGMTRAGDHEAALQRSTVAELFAEDLVRGYRIDVRQFPRDDGGEPRADPPPWRSLHRRRGALRITSPGAGEPSSITLDDEGFVQAAIFQDPEEPTLPDAVRALRIHESLFHWQGWSLSVPPPAGAVDLGRDGMAEAPPTGSGLPRVESAFEVEPNSLPRLRFGSTYQVRARIVDLAGNGPTGDEADGVLSALAASETRLPLLPFDGEHRDESRYHRFEPISAPVLVPREELTEGEAIEVMVVRSNGATTAEYAESLGDPKYHGTNERHVVPPKAAQAFAEAHGVLDAAFGASGDPTALFNLLSRAAGTLNDPFVTSLDTGRPELFPDVTLNAGTSAERTFENGLRFVAVGKPSPNGGPIGGDDQINGYTIHYERQLLLPYLPDPLARGAALFNLPGLITQTVHLQESATPGRPGTLVFSNSGGQVLPQPAIDQLGLVTKVGFPVNGRWPELLPFRLRLDGTARGVSFAPPEWSEPDGARVLTVRLPPGTTRTVWISSYVHEDDMELLGLRWWWRKRDEVEGPKHFRAMAQHGALAMLSPARKMTLVHATQRPVMAPAVDRAAPFHADRMLPHSTAAHVGGRFKVHGPSTAKLDLVATWTELGEGPGGSLPRTVTAHVLEVPIHPEGRVVTIEEDPVPIGAYPRQVEGTPELDLTLLAPERPEHARAKQWLARHELGDTRYRKITYDLVATTRYREYFPQRIVEEPENLIRSTRFADVIVRSSARPPVPEISNVLPTFGWSELVDGLKLKRSSRAGGGLRVYLGASWHASGDDERLAVVEVQAGADPLHSSPTGGIGGGVRPTDANAVMVNSPEGNFRVFPYGVHFDPVGGQWYSDITFDVTGTYFPFIRLTLARYQEHSLDGLQLSAQVHAGFHQLAPNRSIAFDYLDVPGRPDLQRIAMRVNGDGASAAALPEASRHISYRIVVGVEQRDTILPDADLGWREAGAAEQPVVDTASPAAGVLWSGEVVVARDTGSKRRIVVREFELFQPNACPQGQEWIGETDGERPRRLVYVDTILL